MLNPYFISLFLGTFAVEDVTVLAAIALVATHQISFFSAFMACFLGIAIGDFALYIFGYLASRIPAISGWKFFKKLQEKFEGSGEREFLTYAVIASRFIPGTRLPTYTLAGFLRFSISQFIVINIVTVAAWVYLTFTVGAFISQIFAEHWFLTIVCVFLLMTVFRYLYANLESSWKRKIFKHKWRKWLQFEFWPAWLFYIPIVPRYIYLGLKYRSFYLPFYADPFLANAGLIGESKWDIYKYLEENEYSLKTLCLRNSPERPTQIQHLIDEHHFSYPFILKPDVGQRGFAVRVIKNAHELADYLSVAKFDLIIQQFCDWSHEAGVFYVRKPSEEKGQLFSITDKDFPFVTGDGHTKIGDLILQDPRARIIAGTYFERFGTEVDDILPAGQTAALATCGNHCQGAIFKNGEALKSDFLLAAVEKIVAPIPDFYFGRLDIRYLNQNDLKDGRNFKIVEINAAGSEATHIWDQNTTLLEAYKTLYMQWEYLFMIGYQVKQMKRIRYKVSLKNLVIELFKLNRQEKKLAVSS